MLRLLEACRHSGHLHKVVFASTVAVFGGFVVFAVARSLSRSQQSGVSELIGLRARAVTPLDPGGKVFVRGEYWNVDADEQVGDGEWVEVVAVEGLRLRVRRVVGRN